MKPTISLQLSAFAFTVFWFGSMQWVSGTDDLSITIILALCSAIAGYVWYRLHALVVPPHEPAAV